MRVEMEDWKNGWFEIEIGMTPGDIDALIDSLQMIKQDHEQHFHISSDYKAKGGVGQLTFYVQEKEAVDNMSLMSRALAPG